MNKNLRRKFTRMWLEQAAWRRHPVVCRGSLNGDIFGVAVIVFQ